MRAVQQETFCTSTAPGPPGATCPSTHCRTGTGECGRAVVGKQRRILNEWQDDLLEIFSSGSAGAGVACGSGDGGAREEVGELDGRVLLGAPAQQMGEDITDGAVLRRR